jgi:aminopeptidase N
MICFTDLFISKTAFIIIPLLKFILQYYLILFLKGKSSAYDRDFVEAVTAHELAHQWFGNTVTMDWWSG